MYKSSLCDWLKAIAVSSKTLEGKKILVVANQPTVGSLLSDVYSDAGARVTQSNRISNAQLLIAWGGYDLVVINLPRAERDEMLDFIDWAEPELLDRTLILADNASDRRAAEAIQLKYSGCAVKPFVVVELVNFAVDTMATSALPMAA